MATPKKYYSVEGSIDLSSCRLCGIVVDQHYCKNLFNKKNQELLELVHQILGSVLQRDSALPKLVCRSCERKIRNAGILKQTIANTQELFAKKKTRAKRCVDVSPSNIQPQQKTRSNWPSTSRMKGQNPARRSLGFCETSLSDPTVSSIYMLYVSDSLAISYIYLYGLQ